MEESAPAAESPKKSGQKGITTIIAVIIIILLVVGGVIVYGMNKSKGGSVKTASTEMMPQKTPTTAMMHETPTEAASSPSGAMMMKDGAMMMKAGEKMIEVDGANFSFTPKTISVKKGDKVTITFKNTEGFHNFVLDEFNVKTDTIGTGKTATVTFTADKVGTFQYYCSVGNHKAMGMWGTLTVTQ